VVPCGRQRHFLEVFVDELMINLFSLIAGQVRDKQDLFDKEDTIMQSLLNSGYHIYEADTALMLMQTFVQKQTEQFFTQSMNAYSLPLRVMNREERKRVSVEAFSFLCKLTHLGIISEEQREEILEKALTICSGRVELEEINPLIALTLFAHPLEQKNGSAPTVRRIKKTAWN
jgi:uncharacterized protein Smg (DUF494 family)